MNKAKRQKLKLADDLLERAKSVVDEVLHDEEDSLYGLPENLENSMRAEAMEEAVSLLDDALTSIEDAQQAIEEAQK